LPAVQEGRDEEAFAGEYALEAGEDAAIGAGLHLDAIFHVGHRADLGTHAFAWIQLDLDKLQVIANNLVID